MSYYYYGQQLRHLMVRILAVAANSPDPEQSLKAKYQYTSKILVLKNKLIPIFRS